MTGGGGAWRRARVAVGRSDELRELEALLAEARRGSPSLAVVSGDAGIGKSHLVRRLEAEAERRGMEVHACHCQQNLDLPYLPLLGSLLPRLLGVAERDPALRGAAEALARVLGRSEAIESRRDEERALLLVGIARATTQLAQQRGLLLVFDDVQWADEGTLDVLGRLAVEVIEAGRWEPVPFALVVTHRPEISGRAADVVARLRREEQSRVLHLDGLDALDTAELLTELGVPDVTRDVGLAVQEITNGNPLFIETVAPRLRAGGIGILGDVGLPNELQDAVDERLSRLDQSARSRLAIAAHLGATFDPVDLGTICEQPLDEVQIAVDDAVAAGLLIRDGHLAHFAHPLFAESLHRSVRADRQREIHATIATRLLGDTSPADHARLLEIAHHLVRGGDAAEPVVVLAVASAAGERAGALNAWSEAGRAYAAAAEAATRLAAPSDEIAALHVRAGDVLLRAGNQSASARHLEIALEHAQKANDLVLTASALTLRAAIGSYRGAIGPRDDAVQLDEVFDQLVDVNPQLSARIGARLAEVYWTQGRADASRAMAVRAREIADEVGDIDAAVRAIDAEVVTAWLGLDLRGALVLLDNSLARARRSSDAWHLSLVQAKRSLTLAWLGRLDEASDAIREAIDRANEVGNLAQRSVAQAAALHLAIVRGDLEEAERAGEAAWRSARASGYAWTGSMALPGVSFAYAYEGRDDDARATVDRWLTAPETSPNASLFADGADLLRLFATYGPGDQAGPPALTATGTDGVLRAGVRWPRTLGTSYRWALLADVAWTTGAAVDGAAIYSALTKIASCGMVFTDSVPCFVPRVLAIAAALAKQDTIAWSHFDEALATANRMGATIEVGRTHLDMARFLAKRNRRGDADAAREHAASAVVAFSSADLPRWIAAAERILGGDESPRPVIAKTLADEDAVVVLFTDIVDSTALTSRAGDIAFRDRADAVDVVVRAAAQGVGGQVIEGVTLGDGMLATFETPHAVACAEKAHQAAERMGLLLRVGLQRGPVLVRGTNVYGTTVNVAARICAEAAPGETLCGDAVREASDDADLSAFVNRGERNLKGVVRPVLVFAVRRTES